MINDRIWRMVIWLKKKIITWLGLHEHRKDIDRLELLYHDLTNIGIDAHFKEPHLILIFSKLNGGQIRHIEARFESLRELNNLAKELKDRYRPRDIFWDVPLDTHRYIKLEE